MSSAILYVAIVAIWAIVLIPRWLKRDSSAEAAVEADAAEETPAAEEQPAPPPLVREDDTVRIRKAGRRSAPEARAAAPEDRPPLRSQDRPPLGSQDRPRRSEDRARGSEDRARGSRDGREDGRPEEVRRGGGQERVRVVSARRRMLGLLVVLTTGACTLAVTRTAASWVVAPPAVLLVGYLGLLREASKADAERREMTRARSAHPAAAGRAAAPARPATPPAAVPAAVPDAEIIEISTSRGAPEQGGEEFYDQYADAKLRAVGDLSLNGCGPSGPEGPGRKCWDGR